MGQGQRYPFLVLVGHPCPTPPLPLSVKTLPSLVLCIRAVTTTERQANNSFNRWSTSKFMNICMVWIDCCQGLWSFKKRFGFPPRCITGHYFDSGTPNNSNRLHRPHPDIVGNWNTPIWTKKAFNATLCNYGKLEYRSICTNSLVFFLDTLVDMTPSTFTTQRQSTTTQSITPTQTSSDSVESTIFVMDCPAGEEQDGSVGCTACQTGFYKSQSGTGNCTICPINTEGKRSTGSTECGKFAHVLTCTNKFRKKNSFCCLKSTFLSV